MGVTGVGRPRKQSYLCVVVSSQVQNSPKQELENRVQQDGPAAGQGAGRLRGCTAARAGRLLGGWACARLGASTRQPASSLAVAGFKAA